METVVVDTSVVVKWLSQDNEGYLGQADKLLEDLQRGELWLMTQYSPNSRISLPAKLK